MLDSSIILGLLSTWILPTKEPLPTSKQQHLFIHAQLKSLWLLSISPGLLSLSCPLISELPKSLISRCLETSTLNNIAGTV